jgi:hypothetical protein
LLIVRRFGRDGDLESDLSLLTSEGDRFFELKKLNTFFFFFAFELWTLALNSSAKAPLSFGRPTVGRGGSSSKESSSSFEWVFFENNLIGLVTCCLPCHVGGCFRGDDPYA